MDVVGHRGHRSRLLPTHLPVALDEVERREYVTAMWVNPHVVISPTVHAALMAGEYILIFS